GQCLLPAARRLEGRWEVPEPQDLGRRDELRADPVFVQSGAPRPRSVGIEQEALGRSRGGAEPLQSRGTRVSERVPVVTRRQTRRSPGSCFYRGPSFCGCGGPRPARSELGRPRLDGPPRPVLGARLRRNQASPPVPVGDHPNLLSVPLGCYPLRSFTPPSVS